MRLTSAIIGALTLGWLAQADAPLVQWQKTVVMNDVPVFVEPAVAGLKELGRDAGKYGSEYGRMLRLRDGSWLAACTVSRRAGYPRDPQGGLELQVSRSTDGGQTWAELSTLSDPGRDLDNAQLIQRPDGTVLLACRSVRWQESYRLPVYQSPDQGRKWTKLSTIDMAEGAPGELGKPDKGIYEPHLYYLNNGQLAVMYANEKHVTETPSYSQIISQKVSPDGGATWGQEIWVAYEPGHNASRPGMPVWTKLKDGRYMVVYEICGPEKCNIYYKTSPDGTTWPVGLGTPIPDQLGGPYVLALTDGRLVVTSNSNHVSVSTDLGKTWQLAPDAWPNTLWPALYQAGPNQIIAMSSVKRPAGGHNVQIRFGTLPPAKASK